MRLNGIRYRIRIKMVTSSKSTYGLLLIYYQCQEDFVSTQLNTLYYDKTRCLRWNHGYWNHRIWPRKHLQFIHTICTFKYSNVPPWPSKTPNRDETFSLDSPLLISKCVQCASSIAIQRCSLCRKVQLDEYIYLLIRHPCMLEAPYMSRESSLLLLCFSTIGSDNVWPI